MTKEEIHKICRRYNIEDYTINSDMSIDTDDFVNFFDSDLYTIPLKFNKANLGLNCSFNNLTTLKNSPKYMKGSFFCDFNDLETLKDAPKYIKGDFNLEGNNIKTFKYFPYIKGYFILTSNPIDELWSLFKNKNHIDYFNELDIIQENGKVVILDRLNYFLTDIGKKEVNEKTIKNYKVI